MTTLVALPTEPVTNRAVAVAHAYIAEHPENGDHTAYVAAWASLGTQAQWLADDAKKLAEEALKDDPNPVTMASAAREVLRYLNIMTNKTL